jgi:hypothetical protein
VPGRHPSVNGLVRQLNTHGIQARTGRSTALINLAACTAPVSIRTPFAASDATMPDPGGAACHQRGDRLARVLLICFYAHHD